MDNVELLIRMNLRLSARVSALESVIEALLAVQLKRHGQRAHEETAALIRMLTPRQPEEMPQDAEADSWLLLEHRWHVDELCKNAVAAHSVISSEVKAPL